MTYIETAANKFAESINDKVIDSLVQVLEDEIKLSELITQENTKSISDNEAMIQSLVDTKASTEEEADEYRKIQPRLIDTRNKKECLGFGFTKLLESGRTMLHDLDDGGNLTIKIFTLKDTKTFKIKTSYNVTVA